MLPQDTFPLLLYSKAEVTPFPDTLEVLFRGSRLAVSRSRSIVAAMCVSLYCYANVTPMIRYGQIHYNNQ